MKRIIGKRLISAIWIAEIEDHGDGTCTILKYDRVRENIPDYEEGTPVEDEKRTVLEMRIGSENLTVRNQKFVFSYEGNCKGE